MARIKKARVLRMMFCDFCGRSVDVCALMIQGRDEVHICEQCVGKCAEMVLDYHKSQQPSLIEEPANAETGGETRAVRPYV